MKLLLVRHGETDYNHNNRMQGTINISLNDAGRRQCKQLRLELNKKKIDVCFSSPLIRAFETAMILVGDKVEIKKDTRLIERELGDFDGKDRKNYDRDLYWNYDLNSNESGVEQVKELFKRVNDFLSYLNNNYKDETILIVSHGAVIRTLHYILTNTKLEKILPDFPIGNCYYEELEYKN